VPIRVNEDPYSRRLTGVDTFVWKYNVHGTDSIDEVADAVYLASPVNYGFWLRNWPQKTIDPDPKGGGSWVVEVPYNVGAVPLVWFPSQGTGGGPGGGVGGGGGGGYTLPGDEVPLGPEWSADFQHTSIQQRRSQVIIGGKFVTFGAPPVAGDPPVMATGDVVAEPGGGPIAYNPATQVTEGIAVPKAIQQKTVELKVPQFTTKHERYLEDHLFHVNSEIIFGRQPGEVRFEGYRAQYRHADGVTLIFTFAIVRNVTAANPLKIGPFITITEMEGWDYPDPTYEWVRDPDLPYDHDPPVLIYEATKVTIHALFDRSDLNELFA
jgi:hypothetical protein